MIFINYCSKAAMSHQFQEWLKLEIPETKQQQPKWHQTEEDGKLKTHQHRRTAECPGRHLCCSQPWQKKKCLILCFKLFFSLLSPLCEFSFLSSDEFSCLFSLVSFLFPYFPHSLLRLSLSLSVHGTGPRGVQRLTANPGSHLVYESGKQHCHVSCLSARN